MRKEIKKDSNYYKWQFLRRNSKYAKVFKLWESISELNKIDSQEAIKQKTRVLDFCEKEWGLTSLCSPDIEFSGLVFKDRPVTPLTSEFESDTGGLVSLFGAGIKKKSPEKLGNTRFIEVRIDTHASEGVIRKGIINEVEKWRGYAKAIGRKPKTRKTNTSYFDECCKIWDDFKKINKVRDLARFRLKTDLKATNYEDMLRAEDSKIRKRLKDCEQLIAGDFRNINF